MQAGIFELGEFHEFTTSDGVKFRVKPIPPLQAEPLYEALTTVVTPALAALFADDAKVSELGEALSGLSKAVGQFPRFRTEFTKVCQVYVDDNLQWQDLSLYYSDVFRKNHVRYMSWMLGCMRHEFGDFLAVAGQFLSQWVGTLLGYLRGFRGESGESQPTPESATASPT